jgi:hypothetical protein
MLEVVNQFRALKKELAQEIRYAQKFCTRRNQKRHVLLISAFPKSGSTYLWKASQAITGLPTLFPTPDMPHANRTELDVRKLRLTKFESFVCRLHMQATPRNVELMRKYTLRPVVLVRDIADVIVSLDDHLHNEDTGTPSGPEPSWYKCMSEEARFAFLIGMHVPWYINFLLTWHEAEKILPVFWLTYEDLFRDRIQILKDVLEFWGISENTTTIKEKTESIVNENTRLNVGVKGRGAALSIENQKALERLIDCCKLPDILRTSIGIN